MDVKGTKKKKNRRDAGREGRGSSRGPKGPLCPGNERERAKRKAGAKKYYRGRKGKAPPHGGRKND